MTTYSHPNRMRYGPYNIVERYVDGRKVLNYIPTAYSSDYDLSQLDERIRPEYRSSRIVKQQHYYQSLGDDDDNDEEEYIVSPRRVRYASAQRSHRVNRMYYEPAPRSDIIEYVYQEDLRPRDEQIVEYVFPDRTPRKRVR